jgi:hypothetical protein
VQTRTTNHVARSRGGVAVQYLDTAERGELSTIGLDEGAEVGLGRSR